MIRLDDEQYWLYAAVGLSARKLLHRTFERTRTNVLAHAFFTVLGEKHDVDDAVFLVDDATPLKDAFTRQGLGFAANDTEIATASNVSFER